MSSGKLVIGGKSAEQNDKLVKEVKRAGKEVYLMHTSHPGSPFCVIDSSIENVTKKDIDECAIFCGCFSRAWKEGKRKTDIHIFKSNDVVKEKGMKVGTWGVRGKIRHVKVDLRLVLTRQENVLRAVPEESVKKKEVLLYVCPGKIDKREMIAKFNIELDDDFNPEELLAALPAGGVKICK